MQKIERKEKEKKNPQKIRTKKFNLWDRQLNNY